MIVVEGIRRRELEDVLLPLFGHRMVARAWAFRLLKGLELGRCSDRALRILSQLLYGSDRPYIVYSRIRERLGRRGSRIVSSIRERLFYGGEWRPDRATKVFLCEWTGACPGGRGRLKGREKEDLESAMRGIPRPRAEVVRAGRHLIVVFPACRPWDGG